MSRRGERDSRSKRWESAAHWRPCPRCGDPMLADNRTRCRACSKALIAAEPTKYRDRRTKAFPGSAETLDGS